MLGHVGTYLAIVVAGSFGQLPPVARRLLGSVIGSTLFAGWRPCRKRSIYWASRAPGLCQTDIRTHEVARKSRVNSAKSMLDFLASYSDPTQTRAQRLVRIRRGKVINEIAQSKRECLFLSGHIGNWEIIGSCLALNMGSHRNVLVVAHPVITNCFDTIAQGIRRNQGFKIVETVGGVRGTVRALEAGDWVEALVDWPMPEISGQVKCFGEFRSLPLGLVRLAHIEEAPVVIGACWDNAEQGLEAESCEPIDHDASIRQVAIGLEELVLRCPDQ